MLFETFIIVTLIFKLVIIIVIIVIVIIIVVFVVISEGFIVKFIAFDFNIKRRLIISALFDKSQNLIIIEPFDDALLRINDKILLF